MRRFRRCAEPLCGGGPSDMPNGLWLPCCDRRLMQPDHGLIAIALVPVSEASCIFVNRLARRPARRIQNELRTPAPIA